VFTPCLLHSAHVRACVRWRGGQNVGDDGLFASYARLLDTIGASNLGESRAVSSANCREVLCELTCA
jgi:hypothetical protein